MLDKIVGMDVVCKVYVPAATPVAKRLDIIHNVAKLSSDYAIVVEVIAPPEDENPDAPYMEEISGV